MWTYTYDDEGKPDEEEQGGPAPRRGTYTYDDKNHNGRGIGSGDRRRYPCLLQATYVYDALGRRAEEDIWKSGTLDGHRGSPYDGVKRLGGPGRQQRPGDALRWRPRWGSMRSAARMSAGGDGGPGI